MFEGNVSKTESHASHIRNSQELFLGEDYFPLSCCRCNCGVESSIMAVQGIWIFISNEVNKYQVSRPKHMGQKLQSISRKVYLFEPLSLQAWNTM